MPDLAKLKELAALKDSGVLNEEEFAAEKRKILSGEDMIKGTPVQSVQAAAPTSSINMTATQANPAPGQKTGWSSGLFECFNDVPVCAWHSSDSKQLAPALTGQSISYRAMPNAPPPSAAGLGVTCCTPCAYGMLVDMRENDKVLQATRGSKSIILSPRLPALVLSHV